MMVLPHNKETFTYEDYVKIDQDIRLEVMEEQIYYMSPSPTPKHQEIVTQLGAEFAIYLRGKSCRVFVSPIDVCLSDEQVDLQKVKEWVSPDLVVVCNPNKIGDKRIIGSPDLVVEILSPSTAKIDKLVKYNRYEKAGIKEYWIVDPIHESIDAYLLNEGSYKHCGSYFKGDTIRVSILSDFEIDLNNIFRDEDV